ncbi:MAG: VPLPA-CTERM sorting domain-containing protein [Proteobacteria bacterium]|nr:VPLPA-CTERM sorting domain-containing protein [Pseudomonadota bacterium]
MIRFRLFIIVILFFGISGITGAAHATLTQPQVVIDPLNSGNKVVQIQVEKPDDYSWIFIPFNENVVPSYDQHHSLTVSFDIYRPYDLNQEWLWWSWDSDGDASIDPNYGGQDQWGTYPFIGKVTTNTSATIFDRWVNLKMVWDLFENPQPYMSSEYTGDIHGYVSSWYDGTQIDINYPLIINNSNSIKGYFFGLYGFNNEFDIIYLDNLIIEGSPIYDSQGFEDFELGNLDGQDNWQTSAPPAVPIPASLFLLGSGILGLAGIRRQIKR